MENFGQIHRPTRIPAFRLSGKPSRWARFLRPPNSGNGGHHIVRILR